MPHRTYSNTESLLIYGARADSARERPIASSALAEVNQVGGAASQPVRSRLTNQLVDLDDWQQDSEHDTEDHSTHYQNQ